MPALRLRIKLVFAMTLMVVMVVAALSFLYVSEVVRQHIREIYDDGVLIRQEIFDVAREPLETDLSSTRVDINDPRQVENALEDLLQRDPGVHDLLESVVSNSPAVFDAAITGTDGRALVHTNESLIGQIARPREDFSVVAFGTIRKQLEVVYGRSHVYDVSIPITRNGVLFGQVRVGVSTTLLKEQLREPLNHALIFSAFAVLACLVLSAGLSNVALRPLVAISRRLDAISSGQAELAGPPPNRSDEYGTVSNKIERLGRQMRDVKEVFSALKENLDQMMANLQDGVLLFTTDFKAVMVSASAEQFTGKPRSQMLGRHPAEIFDPESRMGQAILRAFAGRQALDHEEIETEPGRRMQISLDFIEEQDERIGALLTLRDAESVHRIEDEIELSRRLSAIGRLTSGVAHEVKNPINAIVVHLEVLRQKLGAADPDIRRHTDVIGVEIKRLDRVVQTLVDFTRPVELRLSETDLRKLVEEVVALAAPEAGRHGVHVEREGGDEPLPVRMDADLVKQAVLNIAINGVQAMPQGGALTIAVRREGGHALVMVRDEGPGVPADIRDKIFNLYFTTKTGGTGIGLSMTYRVVQLHNGSVELDSPEGQGATFYLRFPVVENIAAGEQSRAASQTPVKTV